MNASMRINKVFWSNTARKAFYRLMAGFFAIRALIMAVIFTMFQIFQPLRRKPQ